MPKRVMKGRVVSNSANKTISVEVLRTFMHPIYKKIIRRSKRFAVHDEKEQFKVGDYVKIIECRPVSKTKSFEVIYEE